MASDKPLAIIYTEGKTDWKHLKKAQEKLNIDIPIAFYESEEPLGSGYLLNMCQFLSKRVDNELPGICLFDRDEPHICKKVEGKDQLYKVWDNKYFSFVLPIPEHREEYDENVCIEFYYTDDELRTKDQNRRRIFLSTEFSTRSKRHKYNDNLVFGGALKKEAAEDATKTKIIDSEVFDQNDNNVALSKDAFAENILNDIPPFDNFNFESFRKVFEIIEEILQKEIFPSVQPESREEELPSRFFIGREEQFELFEKYLKRNQPISIEGLGGIGKTAFAEKCIATFGLEDRTVWFPCTQESKLDSLIEMAGFPDLLKIEKLTELAKYSGLTSLLERHEKILFLDDFQEIIDSSFAKFFQFADKRLQNAKIILIAREHPEIRVLTLPIRLQGLEDDHAFDYAKYIIEHNYPELNTNEQDLKAIVQQVKGHPLAIELAIYLLDFGTSPEHLLQAIVEHENEEFLAHRLLDEIFNHPKSTEEEKKFMLAFSVFRDKVKEQAFKYLFEEKDVTSTVRRLRRKLMLLSEDGFYETHPLLREFCYDRLSNKQKWHEKAAEYFQSQRTEHLDLLLEETIFYHLSSSEQWQAIANLICEQGDQFIDKGYSHSLKEMMDRVRYKTYPPQFHIFYGDIASSDDDLQDALRYYKKAFTLDDVDEKTKAKGMINYGGILQIRGELAESLRYLRSSLEICQNINWQEGVADSLNMIGIVLLKQGDLDEALNKHTESLKLMEVINDKSRTAIFLNNIGRVFHERGDFKTAIEKYEESLKIYKEIGIKRGEAVYLNNVGAIFMIQGKLQKALESLQESLEIYKEIGDKSGVALLLNNIGEILRRLGKIEEALQKHYESLHIEREIGNKSRIADSLHNIALAFYDQNELDLAIESFQESLKLREELDNKIEIAESHNNIGIFYQKEKENLLALQHLFVSQAIQNQISISINPNTTEYIFEIRKTLGHREFNILAHKIFDLLSEELKPYLHLEEFTQDTTVRRTEPKVGRNDPCPCGSGKKYKKCCGR